MILALAGGVGGARMAVGLASVLPPGELTIVVNTGDDFDHMGLTVCPDLDTVMYTLANAHNPATGWGRNGESWRCFEEIKRLGGPGWFQLGDRDLAVHVLRSEALRRGTPLSEITRDLAQRFGVQHPIVPMSDSPVRTRVKVRGGELAFQDYFVRLRCAPRVTGFRFAGARTATPPPALARILRSPRVNEVDAVVICPSNPFVSVAPILAVPAIRAWFKARTFPVVAVSPIIGGAAVKGPAAKMMRELKLGVSADAVALHYGRQVDHWVIDQQDAALARVIEGMGKRVLVTDTLMSSRAKSTALARNVLRFIKSIKSV